MLSKYISFLMVLVFVSMVSAAVLNETEVMDTVCNDINLTGTNCTTWWTGLNLTVFNQTINQIQNITYLNVTVVQGGNYTTVLSNFSTIENKTYIYYNYTGNISDFNLTYNQSNIDSKINTLRTDVDSKLTSYALKTENTTTTIKETKNIAAGWKWAFGINMFLTIIIIGVIVMMFKQQ